MKKLPLYLTLLGLVATQGCLPHRMCQDPCTVREANANTDIEEIYSESCLPDHAITLTEAIQIALENNLDVRLQQLELSVQCETYMQDMLREIGQLNAFGEVKHRNRNTGSSSQSLTAQPPAPPSISSEQDTRVFELHYVFNILDYGLAYYQARQDLDRYQILRQRHLRARQNLVLDVFRSYYRAAVARKAVIRAESLIGDLKHRQELIQSEVSERAVSELRGLTQEDRIVDIEIKLFAFRNEYRSAMAELQALMGVPPGCPMELAEINLEEVSVPKIDICELEYEALLHRPELFGQDFQVWSDMDEIRRSIINMYPSVALFGGYNHDDNKFLLYNNWWTVGVRATLDLLSIPSKKHTVYKAWYQRWLSEKTRLSMSMGVLTQVHLAFINVEETMEQYQLAREMQSIKGRKYDLSIRMEEAGQFHGDEVMDFEADALFAELQAYKAYANLQIALEQLSNSVGRSLRFSAPDIGCQIYDVRQGCDNVLWTEYDTAQELGGDPEMTVIKVTEETIDSRHELPAEEIVPGPEANEFDPNLPAVDTTEEPVVQQRSSNQARREEWPHETIDFSDRPKH
ncbi:MAG: TolC family protein [Chlamydiales bacterium]|nr:TolC family protein [Chlamydiales bacterium]